MKKWGIYCLLAAVLLTGCAPKLPAVEGTMGTEPTAGSTAPPESTAAQETTTVTRPLEPTTDSQPTAETVDTSELISKRDRKDEYDAEESVRIYLNGDSAKCSADGVTISGSRVTVTQEGTYVLSGSLNDGMIVVDAGKKDKIQLVLDGVSIHSRTSAPIYILQSDKVFITLAAGSENTLSNGGSFVAMDENDIDAAVFSKEDVTFNGKGSLAVTSPAGHGIVSKDSLTVTGGSYRITCSGHGLCGKDDVALSDAAFTIVSGKDGIHGENKDDAALGLVYIESGSFDIEAEGDGISAASTLQILDGSFTVVSGGGSVNAAQQTSDRWGMGGGHGAMGSRPGGSWGWGASSQTEEDNTSIKGLKAGTALSISGGSFDIDSADDGIHADGNVTVSGGSFSVETGDDGIHADEILSVTGGSITVSQSYEGLEGLHVLISGGDIRIYASDDGLNAAGGADQSGFGGMRGNDRFGGSSASKGSIQISGGKLYVNAGGDGLDANGTITVSGGNTVVCGPTRGDTATLDYDISGIITGGTFIGTGASGMAQSFSDSRQGVIAVRVGNAPAGTQITLTDKSGAVILSHAPELSYDVVILSSPEMVKGQSYVLSVGTASEEFTA
ncbi:MAG: carbohydrate-binding domain-containing protein [Oscillospiraceae bacterium]|nr:carbohydrate-binding domain-containing protein [Oscillospiraceae bacterium]